MESIKRLLLLVLLVTLLAMVGHAQALIFTANCTGNAASDTASFAGIATTVGSTNPATIRIPYKLGLVGQCTLNTLSLPANITLDNSDGSGIFVVTGQTLTVLGSRVNPPGKTLFYNVGGGQGTVVATGSSYLTNADAAGGDLSGTYPNPTVVTGTTANKIVRLDGAAKLPAVDGSQLTGIIATGGSGIFFSNPTASIGLAAVNGTSLTAMRSDAAPALSQAINPVWTGSHTFNNPVSFLGTVTMPVPFTLGGTSVTTTATQLNFLNAATGTTGSTSTSLVFSGSPTLSTPVLGVATGTSLTLSGQLTVSGDLLLNAATANLLLKDTSTGWRSTTTTVVTPQANNAIRSTSFTTGQTGWSINEGGSAEFANIDVRGAIHAGVFVYNALQATAGTLGVFKAAAKLKADLVVPAGPTYGTTTVAIDATDQDGLSHATSQLFVVGDILQLKDGLVGSTWFKVASVSDQTTFWRYTAIIMAGTNTVTYRAGLGIADYGLTTNGFIIQTADQTNAPFLQMATHTATFSSADASGSLITTPQLRLGNLSGSYGYTSTAQVETATVIGTIVVGGNATVIVTAAGMSNTPKTVSVAVTATDIDATVASKIRAALAADPDVGAFFTISGISANVILTAKAVAADDASMNASINNGTCTGLTFQPTSANTTAGSAATYGLGIGQFGAASKEWLTVDQTNGVRIGNNATTLAQWDTTGNITVGQVAASQNNVFISAGAIAIRNNATNRINMTAAGVLSLNDSSGASKITLDAAAGMTLDGKLQVLGASSAIAIGTTPPTSPTAGTGIWLDRTGIYSVNSSSQRVSLTSTGLTITNDGTSGLSFGSSGSINTQNSGGNSGLQFIATGNSTNAGSFLQLIANNQGQSQVGNFQIVTPPAAATYARVWDSGTAGFGFLGFVVGANAVPGAMLDVQGGDISIKTQSKGLVLRATDGATCYRLTVNNAGTLATTAVTCP